jgi:DNA invertase Pin-like site-specific DNA recombinase
LARWIANLMAILQGGGVSASSYGILNLGPDAQTPTGKLRLAVLDGVAQFERELMLQRHRKGIAKTKSAGKTKGRKPLAPERRQQGSAACSRGSH